jgi:hypothetical protein
MSGRRPSGRCELLGYDSLVTIREAMQMTRTGLRIVVGGAVFLSVLIATAFVRARTPQSIATNGPSVPFDPTQAVGDANSLSERENHSQNEEPSSAKPQGQTEGRDGRSSALEREPPVQEDRVAPPIWPITAIPRNVEELNLQSPGIMLSSGSPPKRPTRDGQRLWRRGFSARFHKRRSVSKSPTCG